MRIHHLNCGTFCPFGKLLLSGTGSPFAAGRMVCHCLLIETDRDGLVLVDTGLGLQDVKNPKNLPGWWRMLCRPLLREGMTAVRQVEQLGFKPSDVQHIVLTHLDLDHAGGLADFPEATVHIAALELDATNPIRTKNEERRYLPHQWAHGPKWKQYNKYPGEFYGLNAAKTTASSTDDILLVPLLGHTRGHHGVAIRLKKGWLLHAGDAFFFHDEMDRFPPNCPIGLSMFQTFMAFNNEKRIDTTMGLATIMRSHANDITVICSHDPTMLERMESLSASRR